MTCLPSKERHSLRIAESLVNAIDDVLTRLKLELRYKGREADALQMAGEVPGLLNVLRRVADEHVPVCVSRHSTSPLQPGPKSPTPVRVDPARRRVAPTLNATRR